MMKNAPVIFLDEATANVDPENENELMQAIQALTAEKTVIMIEQTVYHLWQKYPGFLSKQYSNKKVFWPDGFFACSIGEASSATMQ